MQMPDGLIPSSLGPSSALGPGLNSRCWQCPSFGRGQHDGKPSNLLSEQGGEHQDGAWTTGCWWPSPLANPIRLPPHTTMDSFKTNPFEPMSYAFFLLPWQAFPFISTPIVCGRNRYCLFMPGWAVVAAGQMQVQRQLLADASPYLLACTRLSFFCRKSSSACPEPCHGEVVPGMGVKSHSGNNAA